MQTETSLPPSQKPPTCPPTINTTQSTAMFVPHLNEQVRPSIVVSTQCQIRSTKLRLYRLYNSQWKLFSSFENDTV